MPLDASPAAERRLDNVIAAIRAERWAILPDALAQILAIAERKVDVLAVEAQRGDELRNTRAATFRDGVATVPVRGPTFRYANVLTRISGATSYADFATDFNAALKNADVRAILVQIDSPGGQVNGNVETAGLIAAARGIKPVVAYISGTGASAAYLLASAADKIVVDPTAIVGSVGVMASVEQQEDDGTLYVVATQSPKKKLDLASPEGLASMQQNIDAIAQVFIEHVAQFRGVSVDTVLADFGQGDVLVGKAAVDAGLADAVGSYEAVHAALVAETSSSKLPSLFVRPRAFGARADSPRHGDIPMANDQKAGDRANQPAPEQQPAAAAAAPTPAPAAAPAAAPAGLTEAQVDARVEQLFTARMKAEGDRVAGIKALAKKGNEKMIEQCVADASCSVNDAKARLYDHDAALAKAKLDALKIDELKGGKPSSAATPAEGELDARAEGRAMGARVRAMLKPPTPSAASGSSTPTA